tara:strand:+ start:69 stop:578 length:510 start_codon:yes stop_codon:yes gene_type:complete
MSTIVRSYFVPAIDYSISKTTLKEWFSLYGEICRIDFVSHNKPTGIVRRAYIHFCSYNYDNLIENDIKTNGYSDQVFTHYSKLYKLRILINENPIPQTELNLDQVASNTIFIGDQVQEMATKIFHLEQIIGHLDRTLCMVIQNHEEFKQQLNIPPHPPIAPTLSISTDI